MNTVLLQNQATSELKSALLEIVQSATSATISEKLVYILSGENSDAWGSQSRGKIFLFCAGINMTTIRIASAIELYHNISLIIDDVIDNSVERRNNKTFWKRFSKDDVHAISFYMDKLANQIIIESGHINILNLLNQCALEMAEAETDKNLTVKTVDDYLRLAKKKTANFYKAVCNSAAELGKQKYKAEFLELVVDCGISHQIFDDWKDKSLFDVSTDEFLNEKKTNWCFLSPLDRISVQQWHKHRIESFKERFNLYAPKVFHRDDLFSILYEIQGDVIPEEAIMNYNLF